MALLKTFKCGAKADNVGAPQGTSDEGAVPSGALVNGTAGSPTVISNRKFSNPNGIVLSMSGKSYITFQNCTFSNVATAGIPSSNVDGHNPGIEIKNSSNIIFTNCKFSNISKADTTWYNEKVDLFGLDGCSDFHFTESLVENIYNNVGGSGLGDTGNRCIFAINHTGYLLIDYSSFINPGRNVLQLKNSSVGATSGLRYCKVFGSGVNASGFEDMVNHYAAGGASAGTLDHRYNYMAYGGPSNNSTAFIMGDAGGSTTPGHIWVRDNLLYNPGDVGVGIAGGGNNLSDSNIIRATTDSGQDDGQGLYLNNIWGGSPYTSSPFDNNTIQNNQVHFIRSTGNRATGWFNPQHGSNNVIQNNDHTSDIATADMEHVATWSSVNGNAPQTVNVTKDAAMTDYWLGTLDESYFRDDTYVKTGGPTPAGLTFSSGGVISGTPTASGSYTIDYTVTNYFGQSSNGSVQINVSGAATTFTIDNPTDGATGVASPVTFTGTADNSWNGTLETRLTDETNTEVWSGSAWVPDTDSTANWVATAISGGAWSQGPIDCPSGATMKYRARRWD